MRTALLSLLLAATVACADGQPPPGQLESVVTEAGPVGLYRVAGDLEHPWALAFLPDGRMLVTERPGRLRIVGPDGDVSAPVAGTPTVYAQGQGGLLDVALDPSFADNGYVYLSYARPGPAGQAATAVGRGRFVADSLAGFEVLFTQEPYLEGAYHFGSRIVFTPDGHLVLTMAERFQFDPAQDLTNHLGTIVRLNRDGSVPEDNPFVGRADARPEIWSYGHRNIQSAGVHPETGQLWVAEMGPLGGDELNRVEAGANYGWPVVSWGMNYDGTDIPDPPTRPEFADAVTQWTPVISPNGMAFYTASAFPEWAGSALIGSLSQQALVRLVIKGDAVAHQETVPIGMRVRDVAVGPDGHIYLVTDQADGSVLRLAPIETE